MDDGCFYQHDNISVISHDVGHIFKDFSILNNK